MQKFFIYLVFITLVFGCRKEVKPKVIDNSTTQFVSFQNTPKIQDINTDANTILGAWPEFKALQNSFNLMYLAENNEDLVLAIDDLLEKEKGLRESKYPGEFDKMQIKSRQKVLQTFLLKIKASLAENTDIEKPIKQMLLARNAFRNQFNIIVNNKLDTTLIIDEN